MATESQDLLLGFLGQQRVYLGQYLGVGEVELGDCIVWALRHAPAATVALGGDHAGRLALFVLDGAVWTGPRTDAAPLALSADAAILPDEGNGRFNLPLGGMKHAPGSGR
jgi:hypothetical protein